MLYDNKSRVAFLFPFFLLSSQATLEEEGGGSCRGSIQIIVHTLDSAATSAKYVQGFLNERPTETEALSIVCLFVTGRGSGTTLLDQL